MTSSPLLCPPYGITCPRRPYLSWLDVSALDIDDPVDHIRRHGQVMVDGGAPFGPTGGRFVRVNFATSESILERVLSGIAGALAGRPATLVDVLAAGHGAPTRTRLTFATTGGPRCGGPAWIPPNPSYGAPKA